MGLTVGHNIGQNVAVRRNEYLLYVFIFKIFSESENLRISCQDFFVLSCGL